MQKLAFVFPAHQLSGKPKNNAALSAVPDPMPGPLLRALSDAFLPNPPHRIGVAVSGGSDSMALLHLMHHFCSLHETRLFAVTVDHGLRESAKAEAQMVAQACRRLGVRHDILSWAGWDGQGNLQMAAREARYGLMAQWANEKDIATVAVAHTANDQAETVLMRLARKSGVDGLSGMSARRCKSGVLWVRPLLKVERNHLRDYLRRINVDWAEDPSNDDETFERIKARKALEALAVLDIDVMTLSQVAENMEQARRALDWQTFLAAKDLVTLDAGAVILDEARLALQPAEIIRRLIVKSLTWVSGKPYPARRSAVAGLIQAMKREQSVTVDGCHARRIAGYIWIFRELNAVRDAHCALDQLWDDRWYLSGPIIANSDDLTVRALGEEGLRQCPDWRAVGRPHPVLLSTPAVWRGDTVIVAPLAGLGENWHADIDGGEDTFFATLLTH